VGSQRSGAGMACNAPKTLFSAVLCAIEIPAHGMGALLPEAELHAGQRQLNAEL